MEYVNKYFLLYKPLDMGTQGIWFLKQSMSIDCSKPLPLKIPSDQTILFTYEQDSPMT